MLDPILAHGVGRVYESPIPAYLYALGAGGTVLASFLLRALAGDRRPRRKDRKIAGSRAAALVAAALRIAGLAALALLTASAVVVEGGGLTLPALLFWVGLIVGTTTLSAVLGGVWRAADPWATIEGFYRIEDSGARSVDPPWWVGPALLYLLFWFELVSSVGFEPAGVLAAVLVYALLSFSFRHRLGDRWALVDPLSILFGFASLIAPLKLRDDGIHYRGLSGLDRRDAMPRALFASVFVLLASTTLDNLTETLAWSDFVTATGLDALPAEIVDSVALAAFALLFLAPFLGALAAARGRMAGAGGLGTIARSFGWSLVPIGVAYVLAHNAPLLISGIPQLLRALSDPFALGWNVLGTAELFEGFLPSPQLVWYVEIAVIIGGHVLGVLAAHRTAVALAGDHRGAVRSQYSLTILMSVYTIATLWLLAQPLVV
ncbi:MAG: hypothetical protein M3273_08155 [Actinomycetota bacterium]|nr:hypothetical protein [Actinomycetota bacterium]